MLITFTNTDITTKASYENNRYSNYLTSATKSGMEEAIANSPTGNLFDQEYKRNLAINSFYKTLISCFNYDNSTMKDLVYYYVPCVFLIDNNGFYIEYTETYKDSSGYETFSEIITPINKWGKLYSDSQVSGDKYYIEYHLDDSILVTKYDYNNKITTYEGGYKDVYEKLGCPSALTSILENKQSFETEKNEVIILELTEQMTYYINTHDEFYNQKNDAQYHFTLPQVKDEDWGRLIDQPTLFAFLQGVQTPYYNGYVNIYALTSAELTEALSYLVEYSDEEQCYTYHTDTCSLISTTDNKKTYTMEEATRMNAYPCVYCIH